MYNPIPLILAGLVLVALIIMAGDAQFRAEIGQDLQDLAESMTLWLAALFRSSGSERSAGLDAAAKQGNAAISSMADHLLELSARVWAYLVDNLKSLWGRVRFSARG